MENRFTNENIGRLLMVPLEQCSSLLKWTDWLLAFQIAGSVLGAVMIIVGIIGIFSVMHGL